MNLFQQILNVLIWNIEIGIKTEY